MSILAARTYICSCKQVQKHSGWDDELKETTHDCINPKCKKKVGFKQLQQIKKPAVPGIRTPTKNRV